MKKKFMKKILIAGLIVTTLLSGSPFYAYARDMDENGDPIEEEEDPNVLTRDFSGYTTTTLNVRCYVPDEIKDMQATLWVSLFNITEQENYSMVLYESNDYFCSANVPVGDYLISGGLYDSNGINGYNFYIENDRIELVQDEPVSLSCFYGDDTFINTYKDKSDAINIYENETVTEIEENLGEIVAIDEDGNEISNTEVNTETDIMLLSEDSSDEEETQNDSKVTIFYCIVSILLIVGIIVFIRKKKR